MLAKAQRLNTKEVDFIMKNGKVAHSPLFLVRFQKNQPSTRISVVAPVKIAKKAFLRNAIRRKIYASLRPMFPTLTKGLWAMVIAKSNLTLVDNVSIQKDLENLFKKAGIML